MRFIFHTEALQERVQGLEIQVVEGFQLRDPFALLNRVFMLDLYDLINSTAG